MSKIKKIKVIAVTGGIASGKSLAARTLEKLGAHIIDADEITRKIQSQAAVLDAIRIVFGKTVIGTDGRLDRGALREIVFSDPEKLKKLNALIHPLVHKEMERRIAALSQDCKPVFIIVPLLFESGMEKLADTVWTVSCKEETRIRRLLQRDKSMAEETALAIIRAQMSDAGREARSDIVLRNDGAESEFIDAVRKEYNKLGM